ncbi:MAG: hypothetical protein U9R34_02985 [Nanoarchaeota archaeon]|nr:hypothetical protein [Nanoarchaeota archaeon]
MNEKEILNIVADLEDKGEYDEALKYLDELLRHISNSYHALFLKFRISKKNGVIDKNILEKALNEAKIQGASVEVIELIENELNELNRISDDGYNEYILKKIKKIERLIEGANSDGEKNAAINAKKRLEGKRYKKEAEDLIEYRISTEDLWHKKLFVALCRKHNYKPYRYYRQKYTTVMIRISKHYLDNVLWKEYLEYSKQLTSLVEDITNEIISKIHKHEEETVIMGEIEHK